MFSAVNINLLGPFFWPGFCLRFGTFALPLAFAVVLPFTFALSLAFAFSCILTLSLSGAFRIPVALVPPAVGLIAQVRRDIGLAGEKTIQIVTSMEVIEDGLFQRPVGFVT